MCTKELFSFRLPKGLRSVKDDTPTCLDHQASYTATNLIPKTTTTRTIVVHKNVSQGYHRVKQFKSKKNQ